LIISPKQEEFAIAQKILPFIQPGTTPINDLVTVTCEDKNWIYFHGVFPILIHRADDIKMFRLITSQLICSGACRQVEIIKTFGVAKRSVLRYASMYRDEGSKAFFKPRKGRGGAVLTPTVLEKVQLLLDQECSRKEVSAKLNIKSDTLRKAIKTGRLHERSSSPSTEKASTKSSRDQIDAVAAEGLGTACTRIEERLFIEEDGAGASTRFEACLDVPNGGVLCSLPALLANGLVHGTSELLGQVKGYYTQLHVLLLLAFMSLCRIKTVEQLRGHAPGEFGKLMGLDRIPEVRCLRQKMDDLCREDGAQRWATHLSRSWMVSDPDAAGTLYIDGHVRVYHGSLTKLPRRYVSRERLCLRGTSDYWVNDAIGRPFFVIEKAVDPGLLQTLRHDIVPRLLKDIPGQPSLEELDANPHCNRFVLVFDREGYSPAFFKEMWQQHRIACMTYHKHPAEDWPETSFSTQVVTMPNGEAVSMDLAERGSLVGTGKAAMWMREVRKLTESGHQTSLISTAFDLPHTGLALCMFSRWCQENFFRYMMQHYALDLLAKYGTEDIPGTEKVVNPERRELERQRNTVRSKLRYRQARFGEMTHHPVPDEDQKNYDQWLQKKSRLLEEIEEFEHLHEQLKAQIKTKPKHISWHDLAEQDKFYQLTPERKRLIDSVHMIAYRSETAMTNLLRGSSIDLPAARRILQDLFVTEADIVPEPEKNRLRIRIHGASRPAVNRELAILFDQLNAAEICYPGTELRLIYELGVKVRPAEN